MGSEIERDRLHTPMMMMMKMAPKDCHRKHLPKQIPLKQWGCFEPRVHLAKDFDRKPDVGATEVIGCKGIDREVTPIGLIECSSCIQFTSSDEPATLSTNSDALLDVGRGSIGWQR